MPKLGWLVLVVLCVLCGLKAASALLAYPQLLKYLFVFLIGAASAIAGSIGTAVVLIYNATHCYDSDLSQQHQHQQHQQHHHQQLHSLPPSPPISTLERARCTLNRIRNGSRLGGLNAGYRAPDEQRANRGVPLSWLWGMRQRGDSGPQHRSKQSSGQPGLQDGRRGTCPGAGSKQNVLGEVGDCVQLAQDAVLPPMDFVPAHARRPQPPVYSSPTYSGLIWTVPTSIWRRDQLPQDFPPLCEGLDAVSHRWHATLAGGKLVLVPHYTPGSPGVPSLPARVEVPLHGCEVAVVHEPLQGKSTWWKRGPLEVKLRQSTAPGLDPTPGQHLQHEEQRQQQHEEQQQQQQEQQQQEQHEEQQQQQQEQQQEKMPGKGGQLQGQQQQRQLLEPEWSELKPLEVHEQLQSLEKQQQQQQQRQEQWHGQEQEQQQQQQGQEQQQQQQQQQDFERPQQQHKSDAQQQRSTRGLLYGEPSFFFYAEQGAAKEQWYLALSSTCEQLEAASSQLCAAEYPAFESPGVCCSIPTSGAPPAAPTKAHCAHHNAPAASASAAAGSATAERNTAGTGYLPESSCSKSAGAAGQAPPNKLEGGWGPAAAAPQPMPITLSSPPAASQPNNHKQHCVQQAWPVCGGRVSCTLRDYQAFCAHVLSSARVSLPQVLPQQLLGSSNESGEPFTAKAGKQPHQANKRHRVLTEEGSTAGTHPQPPEQQQRPRGRFAWLRALVRRGSGRHEQGKGAEGGPKAKAQQRRNRAPSRHPSGLSSPSSAAAGAAAGADAPSVALSPATSSTPLMSAARARNSCDDGHARMKVHNEDRPARSLLSSKHSASESHLGNAVRAAMAAAHWEAQNADVTSPQSTPSAAAAATAAEAAYPTHHPRPTPASPTQTSCTPGSDSQGRGSEGGRQTGSEHGEGGDAHAVGGQAATHGGWPAGQGEEPACMLASATSMLSLVCPEEGEAPPPSAAAEAATAAAISRRSTSHCLHQVDPNSTSLHSHVEHHNKQQAHTLSPFSSPLGSSNSLHSFTSSPPQLGGGGAGDAGGLDWPTAPSTSCPLSHGVAGHPQEAPERPSTGDPCIGLASIPPAPHTPSSSPFTAAVQLVQEDSTSHRPASRKAGSAATLGTTPSSSVSAPGEVQGAPPPSLSVPLQSLQGNTAKGSGQARTQHQQGPTEAPQHTAAALGTAIQGIHGLNMLLVRLGFELLRTQAFEGWFRRMLQKRLDELKRPAYLHSLKLEALDLGCATPLVTDVRAVAGPGNASQGSGFWPQLVMDVSYSGRISMTVSTKIELQNASLFNNLQTAFQRFKGSDHQPGTASPSSSLSHAANQDSTLPTSIFQPQLKSLETLATQSSSALQGKAAEGGLEDQSIQREQGDEGISLSSASNTSAKRQTSVEQGLLQEEELAVAVESKAGGVGGGGFFSLSGIKRAAASRAHNLTVNFSRRLARMPVELVIDVTCIEGTLMLWIAPPPSDRLWYSFLAPPRIDLSARPVLGGRVLRYGAILNGVSALLRSKLLRAVHKQLVFPACGDVRLGIFAPAEVPPKQTPHCQQEQEQQQQQQQQQREFPPKQTPHCQQEQEQQQKACSQGASTDPHAPSPAPSSSRTCPSSPKTSLDTPSSALPRSLSSKVLQGQEAREQARAGLQAPSLSVPAEGVSRAGSGGQGQQSKKCSGALLPRASHIAQQQGEPLQIHNPRPPLPPLPPLPPQPAPTSHGSHRLPSHQQQPQQQQRGVSWGFRFRLGFRGLGRRPGIQHDLLVSAPGQQQQSHALPAAEARQLDSGPSASSSLALSLPSVQAGNAEREHGPLQPSEQPAIGDEASIPQTQAHGGFATAVGKLAAGAATAGGRGLMWVGHKFHREQQQQQQQEDSLGVLHDTPAAPDQPPAVPPPVQQASRAMTGSSLHSRSSCKPEPLLQQPAVPLPTGSLRQASLNLLRTSSLPSGDNCLGGKGQIPKQDQAGKGHSKGDSKLVACPPVPSPSGQIKSKEPPLLDSASPVVTGAMLRGELQEDGDTTDAEQSWPASFRGQLQPAHHCQIYGDSDHDDDSEGEVLEASRHAAMHDLEDEERRSLSTGP